MTKYFAALLIMFFVAWPSFAADLNGYTALYECRAGGPNCNVDVVGLTQQACQQTITTATTPTTNWTALNQSNNVICIQEGDHTGRGTLTLTSSGTSGTRKILRYTRASDNDDEPWNQGVRAKIEAIRLQGNYWIVHRLTFDADGANISNLISGEHNILNRILSQNFGVTMLHIWNTAAPSTNNTIQNSVARQTGKVPNIDAHCTNIAYSSSNAHIVNNEIYDCAGDGFQSSTAGGLAGIIIENNDIYQTTAMYTDGNGNLSPSGNYSAGENAIDLKVGGTAASPIQLIHNRIWGFRPTDTSVGSSGSAGDAVAFHMPPGDSTLNSYGLIQNNIIFDSPWGIGSPNGSPTNYSIIGNIVWNIHDATQPNGFAIDLKHGSNHEVYLNTFIDTNRGIKTNGANVDVRCNVFMNSGAMSVSGTGIEFDYNAFFNTPAYTSATLLTNIVGVKDTDSRNVEYCFTRKLRTKPEIICIPNVKATLASPHAMACDPDISSQPNRGISDARLIGL